MKSAPALTPAERARLLPNLNVDALQRFLELAAQSPEERYALLQLFSRQPGQNQSFQLIAPADADPSTKALLDEIWAPTWEAWGPDAIANSDSQLPGREIARAKLAATKRRSKE